MRVSYEQYAANWKRCQEGASTHNPREAGRRFGAAVAESVGLIHPNGRLNTRPDGFPQLIKDRKHTCADQDLMALTEAVLGPRWADALGLNTQGVQFPFRQLLREEAIVPVGPSAMMNFSAWTAAIGGLIQAQTLEGYETAEFTDRDLFPTRPVTFWNGGERYVNVIGPMTMAPEVGPGESHPDVRMDGLWVEPAGLKKYGQKLTVTKETAFSDINGRIMAAAREVGYGIAFRENDLVLDVVTGNVNNWKLGLTNDTSATGYNTYGATVPTGNGTTAALGNDITNPMTDPFTTWQASQDPLLQYKHPVTGVPMPMADRLKTVLIPTSLEWFAKFMMGLGQVQLGTQPAAPFPQLPNTSSFPAAWMTGQNPFAGVVTTVRTSQWLFTKHLAATTAVAPNVPTGLGLTLANSRRWYRLDPAAFAARRAAWEMTVIDLNPSDFNMADQGVIAGQVGNIAVQVQVLNAFAVQRNKVA